MEPNYTYLIDYTDLKKSYNYCRDIIVKLKKSKKFYIGCTENPQDRLNDHYNEKKMKTMYVLCKIENRKKAISLEKKLIKKFKKNKKTNKCVNQSGGGEGITEEINYIYVLFR